MTRVLHVFTVPDSLVFLRGQVAFMRERGFEIAVATSPGPKLEAFRQSENVPTYAIEMPRRITPFGDALAITALVRAMRQFAPDIVHAHTPKGGLLGMIAASLAGVHTRIYHMRGLPLMTATGTTRVLLALAERTSCLLSTRVLAVSRSLREYAVAERLASASKILVLGAGSGNGVDCDGLFDPSRFSREERATTRTRFGLTHGDVAVGFVGRLVGDKGVVELLEAWNVVREKHPRARLVVAGVFEERDAVPISVRAALERDPRIRMLGFVEDTPSLYSALDVLVLPTYREGFPNTPLEAASMGLPVVATRVPGCIDAVADELNGILVPPRDAPALAQALDRYLSDPALRERHGEAGRLRAVREFRRDDVWSALATFYRDTLSSTDARSGRP